MERYVFVGNDFLGTGQIYFMKAAIETEKDPNLGLITQLRVLAGLMNVIKCSKIEYPYFVVLGCLSRKQFMWCAHPGQLRNYFVV